MGASSGDLSTVSIQRLEEQRNPLTGALDALAICIATTGSERLERDVVDTVDGGCRSARAQVR